MNHYSVLNVDEHASQKDIKKAYHRQARNLHPDKNNGATHEQFTRLQQAYEVLKDENLRREYDSQLHPEQFYSGFDYPVPPFHFHSFFEPRESFYTYYTTSSYDAEMAARRAFKGREREREREKEKEKERAKAKAKTKTRTKTRTNSFNRKQEPEIIDLSRETPNKRKRADPEIIDLASEDVNTEIPPSQENKNGTSNKTRVPPGAKSQFLSSLDSLNEKILECGHQIADTDVRILDVESRNEVKNKMHLTINYLEEVYKLLKGKLDTI